MKIIVAADIHLSRSAWVDREGLYGDSIYALSQIVDEVNRHDAALVLAGDIFNFKKQESLPVKAFLKEMSRVSPNNRILAIQGQHELNTPPWVTLHPRVEWVNGNTLQLGSTVWYFIDYYPRPVLQAKLADIKDEPVDVLVLHQLCKECIPFVNEEMPNWGFEFSDFPKQVKYVFAGDYHLSLSKEIDGVTFYSIGVACLQAIDEQLDPSILLVDTEDMKNIQRIPIKTRTIIRDIAHTQDELAAIVDRINRVTVDTSLPPELHMPLVYIKYESTLEGAEERLLQVCEKIHAYPLLKPTRSTVYLDNSTSVDVAQSVQLSDCLRLSVDPDFNPQLYAFLYDMLTSEDNDDARNIIRRYKSEIIGAP
jgi:hypothetical protein